MFEAMGRISSGSQWLEGDRVDAATQAELANILGLERARSVNFFLAWVTRHVGRSDTRLLWYILGQRLSFSNAALAQGREGVRGLRYTIDRFRDALAQLAQARAATGRVVRSRVENPRQGRPLRKPTTPLVR
jgi:hypothetical protein